MLISRCLVHGLYSVGLQQRTLVNRTLAEDSGLHGTGLQQRTLVYSDCGLGTVVRMGTVVTLCIVLWGWG